MRKLKHPKWLDWQTQIEAWLSDAVKHCGLTDYRINSAPTRRNIPIRSPERNMPPFPCVQLILVGVQKGWDDMNSGQPDYASCEYTAIGGAKFLKEQISVKERISFELNIFSDIYAEALEIIDTIHRYFEPMKTWQITWQDANYDVDVMIGDIRLEVTESGREGEIIGFVGSMLMTVYTHTQPVTADEVVTGVEQVVFSTTQELDSEESTELNKTIE